MPCAGGQWMRHGNNQARCQWKRDPLFPWVSKQLPTIVNPAPHKNVHIISIYHIDHTATSNSLPFILDGGENPTQTLSYTTNNKLHLDVSRYLQQKGRSAANLCNQFTNLLLPDNSDVAHDRVDVTSRARAHTSHSLRSRGGGIFCYFITSNTPITPRTISLTHSKTHLAHLLSHARCVYSIALQAL